jgi:DNA-binding NtrC family response regulator
MNSGKEQNPLNPILIVDDEVHTIKSFEMNLRSSGLNNIIPCSDSLKVYGILESSEIELILLDLLMPDLSGEEILSSLTERFPEIPVIIVTGINEVDTAVRCMQKGAFDYVLKPVNRDRLFPSVKRAIEVRQLRRENANLRKYFFSDSLEQPNKFSKVITQSAKMCAIFRYCEAVAKGNHPILITGETGVGKELIAEAIHEVSGRQGNLVAINVAGLDDNVFSDTLFGHVRGAFTDAVKTRSGQIERATGGTIFLDEIGDLSQISQVKLLRLLDKHEYFPLGSDVAKPATARFLFATHRDLSTLTKEGRFRDDLYFRLQTHHIHIPPLRERIDDIPILIDYFVGEAAQEFNKGRPACSRQLIALLKGYPFPGNIRELRSIIYDTVAKNQYEVLSVESLGNTIYDRKELLSSPHACASSIKPWLTEIEEFPTLKEATVALINEALCRANNNQRVAASMLGITPQALNQRLKKGL